MCVWFVWGGSGGVCVCALAATTALYSYQDFLPARDTCCDGCNWRIKDHCKYRATAENRFGLRVLVLACYNINREPSSQSFSRLVKKVVIIQFL